MKAPTPRPNARLTAAPENSGLPMGVAWLLLLALVSPFGFANASPDEVKIRGGKFSARGKGAKLLANAAKMNGRRFRLKGWELRGEAHWQLLRQGSAELCVRLAPSAMIAINFEIGPLLPLKSGKASKATMNPQEWIAIFQADYSLLDRSSGHSSQVKLRVVAPDGTVYGGEHFGEGDGELSQRVMALSPAVSKVKGVWRIEISAPAEGGALIDNVSGVRVPTVSSAMHFAKSNGHNGPDRLEVGALGLVLHTADGHAPLPVKLVRDNSSAAKAGVQAGDIIVGLNGAPLPLSSCRPGTRWFQHGHEAMLGRAIQNAFAKAQNSSPGAAPGAIEPTKIPRPAVSLTILRGGKFKTLTCALQSRSSLSGDFPFGQSVTPKLYDDLLAFIRRTRKKNSFWANGGNAWIQSSLCGLALLGRRDPQDFQAIEETATWFLKKFKTPKDFGNLGFWSASYAGIFLTEYYIASGDKRVEPWIEMSLKWISQSFRTSKWGIPALGHGPNGLPYGEKALMAPASHVVIFEALALKAGFKSKIWETLWPYTLNSWSDPKEGGHGAMGYNGAAKDNRQFWSRTGLVALATHLRGSHGYMRRHLIKVMRERHPWMRNSHAYGNPGDTWGLIGLAGCDREAFAEVMEAWSWSLDGAWQPGYGLRHSTAHMGSPYMGGEGLINPAWAVVLSARHRGLVMTGAPDSDRLWMQRARQK